MVSHAELERRWKSVRAAMSKEGLDWIICEGTYKKLGGYSGWFTGRMPTYNAIVAFPIEGDLYYVSHGGGQYKSRDVQGIKHTVKPYLPTLQHSTGADLVVEILRRKKADKIGFAGYGTLVASTYLAIVRGLPDAKFMDASDIVDGIKAVKSQEELEYIKHTIEIHDKAWEVAIQNVGFGKRPTDVLNKVIQVLAEARCLDWTLQAGATPKDGPPGLGDPIRVMKEGDIFTMRPEFSGPEGYWTETRRCVCLGMVPNTLVNAFEVSKEAQNRIAKLLLPNADPNEVLQESNEFLIENGYPPEGRLAGHGQGYDIVERPALYPLGETLRIKAGMVVNLHAYAIGEKAWGLISDNFLVTENGGERITKVPQEIFVV